jgi:SAM-dependent methyltransferase
MDDATRRTQAKYDRAADAYSSRYANPAAIAARQVELVQRWGARVPAGAAVLEVGCADGFVTEQLCRAGFQVTALDISPRMIEAAGERLAAAGLTAELLATDLQTYEPAGTFDVTVMLMGNFFHYVDNADDVLRRLGAATTRRLLVDLNPRATDLRSARAAVAAAGFSHVSWRPLFVPQTRRVGPATLAALRLAERVPGPRRLILRKFGKAVVKGERA